MAFGGPAFPVRNTISDLNWCSMTFYTFSAVILELQRCNIIKYTVNMNKIKSIKVITNRATKF